MKFIKMTAAEVAAEFRAADDQGREVLSLKYGGTLEDWEGQRAGDTVSVAQLEPLTGDGIHGDEEKPLSWWRKRFWEPWEADD